MEHLGIFFRVYPLQGRWILSLRITIVEHTELVFVSAGHMMSIWGSTTMRHLQNLSVGHMMWVLYLGWHTKCVVVRCYRVLQEVVSVSKHLREAILYLFLQVQPTVLVLAGI